MSDTRFNPPNLTYAPAGPGRRRLVRRVVVLALLASAAFVSWRVAPAAWRHAQHAYWQHRCLTHTLPPETAVFDDDPQRSDQLLAAPSAYALAGSAPHPIAPDGARPVVRVDPVEAGRLGLPAPGRGYVFLHERRTPGGQPLLVATSYRLGYGAHPPGRQLILETALFIPGDLSRLTRHRQVFAGSFETLLHIEGTGSFRVFAAQPDPVDPSRFVVTYEIGDRRETVNVQVCDPTPGGSTCGNAQGYQVHYFRAPTTDEAP